MKTYNQLNTQDVKNLKKASKQLRQIKKQGRGNTSYVHDSEIDKLQSFDNNVSDCVDMFYFEEV